MKDVVNLTAALMKFRTTADNPREIARCADFIVNYLRGRGMVIKKYVKNGKISIVALFRDVQHAEIFFNAHFDVVPAPDGFFRPKIRGDRLYGRGSEDCKAQVALLMHLMARLSKSKPRPDVGIMLTSDEEVHGRDGVQYLLEKQGYSCEFAVVADGGDNYDIITKHKGVLQVKVSAKGRSAHSAFPWQGGDNAIEKLISAYPKIAGIFQRPKKAAWKTTGSLTKIRGGDVLNRIPDYAELFLDVRRTEKDTERSILRKLNAIRGIRAEKTASADMLNTDPHNPYVKKLRSSAEKVLKRKVKTAAEHGATDARYFSARGIPAILFKPLGFGPHSEEEHLVISSLKPYFEVLLDFVSGLRKI